MSLILDALKKAESERNRRVAPVLMDARVAPPRRALPGWAWVLAAVLLANLAVLAWLLLREPAAGRAQAGDAPAAAVTAPGAAAQDAPAAAGNGSTAPAPGAAAGPAATAAITPGTTAAGSSAPPSSAPSTDPRTLPTLQELRAGGVALPDLQLELHVYDPSPANRSVLLNGQRLREGEYSPNGVRLERITPEGVVLEAAGRRFRLDAGG